MIYAEIRVESSVECTDESYIFLTSVCPAVIETVGSYVNSTYGVVDERWEAVPWKITSCASDDLGCGAAKRMEGVNETIGMFVVVVFRELDEV